MDVKLFDVMTFSVIRVFVKISMALAQGHKKNVTCQMYNLAQGWLKKVCAPVGYEPKPLKLLRNLPWNGDLLMCGEKETIQEVLIKQHEAKWDPTSWRQRLVGPKVAKEVNRKLQGKTLSWS